MASVTLNPLIAGFHGRIGNSIVLKTINGRTYASRKACKPDRQKETNLQRETRINFRAASQWASNAIKDPVQKEYYRKRAKALGLTNAYTAALTDRMRAPCMKEVDQNKHSTMYHIHKKNLDLSEVKVVLSQNGITKEIDIRKPKSGKPFVFQLTTADRRAGAIVHVTDATGIIRILKIPGSG